jgi:chromosome segregation ATPase
MTELEVAMSDVEKDRITIQDAKSKLPNTYGKLVYVTQKYERTEINYQEKTCKLASSLTELKGELDDHNGTKQELAEAATNLTVAHSDINDAAIDIDEARKQIFETSAELLAANDDFAILEGLYRCHNFQEAM